ncbi:MAG: GGDEF domain-containing protein [Spirochaetales bacterium]|jgi:diguanylate cyclase (GGDEF)-like protein|nr:GGDEF domain-containing protein [Spirochaetales bacterium]
MQENAGQAVSKDYLKHYDELRRLGLWDYLTGLERSVLELEGFFSDALNLFNIQTAGGLIEFVISRFLDKFIPEHLLFVIEDTASFEPETYYFRRLIAENLTKPVIWYKELKEVFPYEDRPVVLDGDKEWISSSLLEDLRQYETSLILPMRGIGGVFGFVLFSSKVLGTAYTESEISYVRRLIQFFSVGLQNSLNHQSSITDLKTGLFNHAYFMRRLEEELFRGRRYKTETALLLMDIDFFKRLNDTHGHLAGDAVLQAMAKIMKGRLRTEDVLSRFGGEEFTLLLPATPTPTALEIAERLRKAVENMKVPYGDKVLFVTVSIGCAVSGPSDLLPPPEILRIADESLYKSKENGRNRVTLYEQQDAHTPNAHP